MSPESILLALLIVLLAVLARRLLSGAHARGSLPLPPGPKPLPLLANLLDVPNTMPWKTYTEWSHKYGTYVCHNNSWAELIP